MPVVTANVHDDIQNNAEKGLSLRDILFIIKKHIISLLVCIIVGGAAGFTYANFMQKPTYTAKATMLASYDGGTGQVSMSDYNFLYYFAETFVAFIKEDAVLKETSKYLYEEKNLEYTAGALAGGLSASSESLIITVTFTDYDQIRSAVIVNALVDTARKVANSKDENGDINYKLLAGNLVPVSYADETKGGSTSSHKLRYIALFALAGLAVAVVYIVIVEMLNNKFKSTEEIEQMLGLPVLAGVPYYTLEDFPKDADDNTNNIETSNTNNKEAK